MRVLHLVPLKFNDESYRYIGSTKDIRARHEYFRERGIPFDLLSHGTKPPVLLKQLSQIDLKKYTHILLEKGNFVSVLKYLRKTAPHTKIWFRGHNAEILHRWDYLRATAASPVDRPKFRDHLYNLGLYGTRDYFAARLCDRVLAICDWEVGHYWNQLGAKGKAVNLPFYLSEEYESEVRAVRTKKKNLCICFTSSHPGPITNDAVQKFLEALRGLKGKTDSWDFVVSGKLSPELMKSAADLSSVVRLQWFESPTEALSGARAMIILSNYGRGFKTKLLEAVLCRTFVICPEGLFDRLPEALRPYCIVVDPKSPESLREALRRCEGDFPEGNPNELLKREAYLSLDRLFRA